VIPRAYRDLFAIRETRLPLIASAVGRLPLGSTGLAVLLLVKAKTGSFADAGLVSAALTLGAAISLPIQGRLIDRFSQTPILIVTALGSAVSFVAFIAASDAGASVAVLALLCFLGGVLVPPLGQCMRGILGKILDDEQRRQAAYALDAVILEFAFIGGPLLAAGLSAAASPRMAVLAGVGLELAGTLAFAATRASRAWRSVEVARHWLGPLRSAGLRILGICSFGHGLANGALVVALTAFGAAHGSPEASGPLIAIQALASLVGGVWFGAQRLSSTPERQYVLSTSLLALGFVPLIFAGSIAMMGVLVVFAGLALAPSTAIEYLMVDRVSPAGTTTEAFGWLITAAVTGAGAGEALAGAIVQGGEVRLGLVLALGGVVLSAGAAVLGRPALARSVRA
jgi:MFS family permease